MDRARRDSRQHTGITVRVRSQLTSATKSAQSGHFPRRSRSRRRRYGGLRCKLKIGNLPAASQPTEQVMRALLFVSLLVLTALPALAAERWETLPPTPAPIATDRSGQAQVNGISIHYRIYGQDSPV